MIVMSIIYQCLASPSICAVQMAYLGLVLWRFSGHFIVIIVAEDTVKRTLENLCIVNKSFCCNKLLQNGVDPPFVRVLGSNEVYQMSD